MKTIIFILAICLLPSYILHAQDTTLPQGKSRIQLHSGKAIKQVRLWRIDTKMVEYVKEGNLADVQTSDVLKIETPEYLLTFDDDKKMQKRQYDLIIPYYADTIRCIIQNINRESITFIQAGSNSKRVIANANVVSYLKRKNASDFLAAANVETQITGNQDQEQKIVLLENNNIISSANVSPASGGHYINDDLIITTAGDTIRCTIDRADNTMISYHIDKSGVNPKGIIPLKQVMKYTDAKSMKTKKSAGEVVGKTFLGIGVGVSVIITMALLTSF